MEKVETDQDTPNVRCEIKNCGEIAAGEDDTTVKDDGTGDKYPAYPDDIEDITTAKRLEICGDLRKIGNAQFKGL